jgi:hypothetical protein
MPQLKDAHFLPGGEWILGTTKTEVLLFAAGTPDRPAARVPVSAYENVVMVEWATGPHVSRWAAEVRRARQAGRVQPLVR